MKNRKNNILVIDDHPMNSDAYINLIRSKEEFNETIFHKGKHNETYNIGGFNEWKNIDLIKVIIKVADRLLGREEGESEKLITYVQDRAGHDLRYAIDASKIKDQLGWEPSLQFKEGIEKTIKCYLENKDWLENITSGDYQKYYSEMYQTPS